MSQTTQNTSAFIEAEVYSKMILENLHDGLLPEMFYRTVTDFSKGLTLNIKTIGSVEIQEVAEDTPLTATPIDTNTITMNITEYVGDKWYVTDDLYEEGAQINELMAARAAESTRALQETFESKFLKACNNAQTDGVANAVNGFDHRIASADADNNVFGLKHLIAMKLAFDKANVPLQGRVLIVDPVVEATINSLVTIVSDDQSPIAEEVMKNGFAQDHKFIKNIMGWNIITSNRLPKGSFGDGTTAIADGVANIFMCVADDNCKPIMQAWRRMPKVEGDRDFDNRANVFQTTSRYGFGVQRKDTIGTLITSASNY